MSPSERENGNCPTETSNETTTRTTRSHQQLIQAQQSTSSTRFLLQSQATTELDLGVASLSPAAEQTGPAGNRIATPELRQQQRLQRAFDPLDCSPASGSFVFDAETTAISSRLLSTVNDQSEDEHEQQSQRHPFKRRQRHEGADSLELPEFAAAAAEASDCENLLNAVSVTHGAQRSQKSSISEQAANKRAKRQRVSCGIDQDDQDDDDDEREQEQEQQRLWTPRASSRPRDTSSRDYSACWPKPNNQSSNNDNNRSETCVNCSAFRRQVCGCARLVRPRLDRDNMATKNQSVQLIPAYFVAELVGTFLLVAIGDGAIAAYVLARKPLDLFSACFAFGVGAMIASFARWRLLPVYLVAQYLGGFLAALMLFVNYREAIESLDGGERSAFGSANSTGGVFATYPASYVSAWGALLDQVVGTAVLLFSICAVTDRSNHGLEERHQPLVIAFVIGIICVAFSPNCGAIFNPARDLAPRLVTALLGYPAVWAPLGNTYWLLAGVLGPHLGAVLGLFGYKYTIGYALGAHKCHTQQLQQQQHDIEHDKHQRLTSMTQQQPSYRQHH